MVTGFFSSKCFSRYFLTHWATEKNIFKNKDFFREKKKKSYGNCLQRITQKLKRKKKQVLTGLSLSSQEMLESYSPFSNEMSYLENN